MSTPSTTAPSSLVLAALVPIQGNATYAALTNTEKTSFLDASLAPVGDFKAVMVANSWWDNFLAWLRELIDSAADIWQDIIDRIKDQLEIISGLPWYWAPLPVFPIPAGGV